MEKLIKLLNEWELEVGSSRLKWYIGNNPIGIYCKSSEYHFGWASKIILISKEYGFIKWLVDNDKIDTDPIRTRVKRVYVEFEPRELTPQDFVDRVIMLLSISDTPIDDLVSYLR